MKILSDFKLLKELLLLTTLTMVPCQQNRLTGQETRPTESSTASSTSPQQRTKPRTLDDLRKAAKSRSAGQGSGDLADSETGGRFAGETGVQSSSPGGFGSGDGGSTMGSAMGGGVAGGMPGGIGGGMPGMGGPGMMMGSGMPTEKQQLLQLIQSLRDRLGSPKYSRQTVEKQLRAALQQYFDADMLERLNELDKVKSRLAQMESKLQRRLNSDQEIIDLQLKQMLHKADGLDFNIPGGDGSNNFGSSGSIGGSGGGMAGGMAGGMGGPGGYGEGGGMMMSGLGGRFGDVGLMGGIAPGGIAPGGMGVGGMDTGGLGSDGMGAGGLVSVPTIGYDVSFALTRVQRLEGEPLDAQDPLRSYIETSPPTMNDASQTNSDKLKTILLAFHQFNSQFNHLPRSANRQIQGQPAHSWRVAILPLLGENELYKAYKFDQPWDSPDNLKVAEKMPEIYRSHRNGSISLNATPFQILIGDGAYDSSNAPPTMADITDGTSNTLVIIESSKEVIWTKPEDVRYSALNRTLPLAESRLVGFCDGHIQSLPKDLDAAMLHALVTRNGGELATLPQ